MYRTLTVLVLAVALIGVASGAATAADAGTIAEPTDLDEGVSTDAVSQPGYGTCSVLDGPSTNEDTTPGSGGGGEGADCD